MGESIAPLLEIAEAGIFLIFYLYEQTLDKLNMLEAAWTTCSAVVSSHLNVRATSVLKTFKTFSTNSNQYIFGPEAE